MKKKIKRIFPFLICFCLFFLLVDDVSAMTFLEDQGRICYDTSTYKLLNEGSFAWSNCTEEGKTYVIRTNEATPIDAYCSDKELFFLESADTSNKNRAEHALDSNFISDNECVYYKDDVKYDNGDCSKIVSYVIEEGRKIDVSATQIGKWFNAQAAVWVYLGKFSTNYKINNDNVPVKIWDEDRNKKIKETIKNAWKSYVKSLGYPKQNSDINFSVNASDSEPKFYYVPNGSECGGGSYVTKEIKITNNSNRSINVTIEVANKNDIPFAILVKEGDKFKEYKNGKSISLSKNQTKLIKLATHYAFDSNVDVSFIASYQGTSFTYRNSNRYEHDDAHQGIIVPTSDVYTVESTKKISFSQVKVEHRKCKSADNYGNRSGNIYPQTNDGNPVTKKCASNVVEKNADVINKLNEYQVGFSGCNCMTIDLSNSGKVNVLLYENVGFRFGTLTSGTVYPGGGFQFSTNNGISTTYKSKITWRYADYANNVPYYYNPNNLSLYDARAFEDEISNKIKDKLNDEIILNISTLDSNDAKDSEQKNIDIPLNFTSVDYDENNRVFTIKVNNIKMNEAYFSVDGTVNYEKTDKFFIDGGNKYYVPLHYVNSTEFPFNINLTNLSALPNMNFYYQAECGIKIDIDGYLYGNDGVRYRSVDLSNPFPKANEKSDVPYNWQEWYWNNATNMIRLKNAFQHYPNEPLYGININSNKLNKIGNLTDFYTSWSNINSDGSSEFVLGDQIDFYEYANDNSYCEIGKFSADCDK